MKKLFVVLCIAAVGFSFTSCKKNCNCYAKDGSLVMEYTDLKKDQCETLNTTAKVGGGKCEME